MYILHCKKQAKIKKKWYSMEVLPPVLLLSCTTRLSYQMLNFCYDIKVQQKRGSLIFKINHICLIFLSDFSVFFILILHVRIVFVMASLPGVWNKLCWNLRANNTVEPPPTPRHTSLSQSKMCICNMQLGANNGVCMHNSADSRLVSQFKLVLTMGFWIASL